MTVIRVTGDKKTVTRLTRLLNTWARTHPRGQHPQHCEAGSSACSPIFSISTVNRAVCRGQGGGYPNRSRPSADEEDKQLESELPCSACDSLNILADFMSQNYRFRAGALSGPSLCPSALTPPTASAPPLTPAAAATSRHRSSNLC